MKKLQQEVEKKKPEKNSLKLSVTEKGKEGKIASCGFLEEELRQCSKEEVTMADSVETLGVDLRTRIRRLWESKEKARRKKCKVRFSIIKKNMKVEVKKLLRAGMTPARTWGAHAVGMSPTERLKLVRQMAAAGWQEEYNLAVLVHGGTRPWSRGRALHHGYSILGRRSLDRNME